MTILPKQTIQIIAQSIGINNLPDDVAAALAPEVEYRMREIMQEAIKCMLHSKRTILTTDDVNSALQLRNIEPSYGFASGGPLRFKKALGHTDLFYIDDGEVELKEVMEAPLPKVPIDTAVVAHWLAIEGVQPAIPENAPLKVIAPPDVKRTDTTQSRKKDEESLIDLKLPVKHVLSQELQLYFAKITELIISSSNSDLFKAALNSLATDSGLHPLIPYFTQFVADEVVGGLDDLQLLFALMRVVRSLLLNPHVKVDLYLHQLMPSVITCLVAKRLGGRSSEGHWELRDYVAGLIAFICRRYGRTYTNLQPRITKTLLQAFLDPKRSMTQHYGAIKGLAALGPRVVSLLVLPYVEAYLELLLPELSLETQKNEMKRYEAMRVYGALLNAVGTSLASRLKSYPMFMLSHTWNAFGERSSGKVDSISYTSNRKKRIRDIDGVTLTQKKPETENLSCYDSRTSSLEVTAEENSKILEGMQLNVDARQAGKGMWKNEDEHMQDVETTQKVDTETTHVKADSPGEEHSKDEHMQDAEATQKVEGASEERMSSLEADNEEHRPSSEGASEELRPSSDGANGELRPSSRCASEEQRRSLEIEYEEGRRSLEGASEIRTHSVKGVNEERSPSEGVGNEHGHSFEGATHERRRSLPDLVKSSTLSEFWKEDTAIGPLLASLVELFGDSILPFVPNQDLSVFI